LTDRISKCRTLAAACSTLPHGKNPPTKCQKRLFRTLIAHLVLLDLLAPELRVCCGILEKLALMPVPKTPVDLDDGPVLGQHDVRATGKVLAMNAEPKTLGVKRTA